MVNTGGPDPKPPTPYDLRATPQDAGTTWDVAIDGSNAVITLRMLDLSPSGSGAFLDVTINVRCDQPAWGGAEPEPTDGGPVEVVPEPTDGRREHDHPRSRRDDVHVDVSRVRGG